MIIGTKALIGIGLAGAGVVGLGVGGHALFAKKSIQTIKDRIKGKTPLAYYVGTDSEDQSIKQPWTDKVNSYKGSTEDSDREGILEVSGIDEIKLSKKCKEILEIPLKPTPENLDKKVKWAEKWCFAS